MREAETRQRAADTQLAARTGNAGAGARRVGPASPRGPRTRNRAAPSLRAFPASGSSARPRCWANASVSAKAIIAPASSESEELERLTASRERIGPVNLVAAEELARIEGEHGSSARETGRAGRSHRPPYADRSATSTAEGRERLRAAFDEGGRAFPRAVHPFVRRRSCAFWRWSTATNPLEAGLEIYAQPPGKRFAILILAVGGETALTATALIFALFPHQPRAICVLDEVDAPLDDANVERFFATCSIRWCASTTTRYLIVTHTKKTRGGGTMSRMHRLFGVTMAEKGVSRLATSIWARRLCWHGIAASRLQRGGKPRADRPSARRLFLPCRGPPLRSPSAARPDCPPVLQQRGDPRPGDPRAGGRDQNLPDARSNRSAPFSV